MDERLQQLKQWLKKDLSINSFDITPASGDASFRRYFRLRYHGQSQIVMDAPPGKEDCRPFIKVARIFLALGLNVPEILAEDLGQGFLLLSDLGAEQYLDNLNPDSVDRLYGDALDALMLIQAGNCTKVDLPDYDHALLSQEMGLFRDWFLVKRLGLSLSEEQRQALDQVFEQLVQMALEQPRVIVHRDYHSRNLMVTTTHNPGILDFQDAVIGPVTYDLVSLLRDCYISWPEQRLEQWIGQYFTRSQAEGSMQDIDKERFIRWFDWMGAQRHLKAIGIFSRLDIRDQKPAYLKAIPQTMAYLTAVARRYPELQPLHRLLRDEVLTKL